jgi:hypothetical protein
MESKKNYVRDYQDGMCSQREQAFTEVMGKQSKYDFLEHQTPTSKEKKKELIGRIAQRVKKLQRQLLYFVLITVLCFSITSCNKSYNDEPIPPIDNREKITQIFTLDNITTRMGKGFDPATWVYNYTTREYNLTFTSTTDPMIMLLSQ